MACCSHTSLLAVQGWVNVRSGDGINSMEGGQAVDDLSLAHCWTLYCNQN